MLGVLFCWGQKIWFTVKEWYVSTSFSHIQLATYFFWNDIKHTEVGFFHIESLKKPVCCSTSVRFIDPWFWFYQLVFLKIAILVDSGSINRKWKEKVEKEKLIFLHDFFLAVQLCMLLIMQIHK